jgi:hypothetical protein
VTRCAYGRSDRSEYVNKRMKTYRILYPEITSFENLESAWRKARKGKRGKLSAAQFEFNVEGELLCLQRDLQNKSW